ncbi:MAG: hypothetical protein SGARI_008106 [Bacillariaceae sp.]
MLKIVSGTRVNLAVLTLSSCLDSIETNGLLNQEERGTHGISGDFHGAIYGEGIYTADPQAYQDYGKVGLIVARLKGTQMHHKAAEKGYTKGNTCITSKHNRSLVVLEKRFQVVPLVQYPMEVFATNDEGLSYLKALQHRIQTLLDQHFNTPAPQVNGSWLSFLVKG